MIVSSWASEAGKRQRKGADLCYYCLTTGDHELSMDEECPRWGGRPGMRCNTVSTSGAEAPMFDSGGPCFPEKSTRKGPRRFPWPVSDQPRCDEACFVWAA